MDRPIRATVADACVNRLNGSGEPGATVHVFCIRAHTKTYNHTRTPQGVYALRLRSPILHTDPSIPCAKSASRPSQFGPASGKTVEQPEGIAGTETFPYPFQHGFESLCAKQAACEFEGATSGA